jgi:hypothetical protein
MAETRDVAIVNAGDTLVPAATVTEAGMVTPGSLLERVTTVSTGAMPLIVTLFAVVETLPVTEVGDKVTETKLRGVTVSVAVFFAPALVAEIVAVVVVNTALVPMVKVAPKAPSAMETVAGTDAAPVLLERPTEIPPEGALSLRLTYPVVPAPPMTETGDIAKPASKACGTSVFLSVVPPEIAVMYNGESTITRLVLIGNETVV